MRRVSPIKVSTYLVVILLCAVAWWALIRLAAIGVADLGEVQVPPILDIGPDAADLTRQLLPVMPVH